MHSSVLAALRHFVQVTKLHPVLVNFTAALIPASVASDLMANYWKKTSLRDTAWWTLLYATIITPFTAISGWLFWMPDDNGSPGMAIHKRLGSALAILLFVLIYSRWQYQRRQQYVSAAYLIMALLFVAALIVQGHLGGDQVFSGM